MDAYRIAVLVGSLRKDSFDRRLAAALAGMAPQPRQLLQPWVDRYVDWIRRRND